MANWGDNRPTGGDGLSGSLNHVMTSRLTAKVMVALLVALVVLAGAVIGLSYHFAQSIGRQAADQSEQALLRQADHTLQQLTYEQTQRYNQYFRQARIRARNLARSVEDQLHGEGSDAPEFPLDLRWDGKKAFHTNGSGAPISLLHWGDKKVSPDARRDMRQLTHLAPDLRHAQEEVFSASAAWITTENRVVAYAPNRPLIDHTAPASEANILASRFYTVAKPANAPDGRTRWTQVYEDPAGQGLMATAAAPIYAPGGQFFGVAGIDVTLESLTHRILTQDPLQLGDQASSAKIEPPAQMSILMDEHAHLIAFPKGHEGLFDIGPGKDLAPGEVHQRSLLESANPAIRRAARKAVASDSLFVEGISLKGTEYQIAFQRLPVTDWVLANVVAEEAILADIRGARGTISERVDGMVGTLGGISLGVVILALLGLTVFIVVTVLRPLRKLTTGTDQLQKGHYGAQVSVSGNDELAQLGEAFNELSQRLASLFEDLERRVEERTREAESAKNYFRTILDSSPVGIAFLDGQRRIQQVNPAFTRLLGRPEEAVLGRTPEMFYSDAEEYQRLGEEAYPLLEAGEVFQTVTTLQCPDGTLVDISLKGRAVDPQDLGAGYIWILEDITEQEERERALVKFRAVFESSRDAVTLLTEQGYLDCNPAALTLFEIPAGDGIEHYHPADLSPAYQPDGRPSPEAAQERIRQAFEQGQAFFEWHHRTVSGITFPTEVLLSRVDLEEGPILESVVRDISEQKAAFERVEQARRRAEEYFEVARVMMLVLDLEGRIAAINHRGSELLGLSQDELVGKNWFHHFLPEEEKEKADQVFQSLQEEGDGVAEHMENEVVTATGEQRLIAFRNAVLRNPDGELEGILSSGYDVTDQRALEAKLDWQAHHDPLTGVYNRRRAETLMDAEIRRSRRYDHSFSLILFDIDHFKEVNDQFGHEVGDRILRELTRLVSNRLRDVDMLARWGGEEFLILLPETGKAGAQKIAEDLRSCVAGASFSQVPEVTISLGTAELEAKDSGSTLTKKVDDALYAAKNGGRNQVT